ncbi:hypothetical protein COV53_04945 [Candidatus Gottesmanbacteria bacterium CG11_big_fil_rev_8_21_14_0_20_37_11]|uniref:SpoVT-AbrB domain-containing protein n=2 Tax=Patescibacteria group TaxID=1783273 RepID=A0A2H0NGT0_9BACT|nr:MAG: hypothetical protein AUJ29_00775 [Candidatus Kuenenbacteria bacterium CG1_02_38_13]PIR08074.1 MAG: hypothetical protein COV53_04945 [Candidatus Gottesmanbacteria bacterium CG11_big_fil_rev_8_21_14_0_20_37_11]
MLQTITITPKWQIYIPEKIRLAIGLFKPTRAEITVRQGTILIKPKKSRLLQMAGKYHHLSKNKKIDLDNIRDVIDYSNI